MSSPEGWWPACAELAAHDRFWCSESPSATSRWTTSSSSTKYPAVGVEQERVLVAYGVAAVALLWWLRRFLRENEWPLLALAGAFLGFSYALDLEEDMLGWREENAGALRGDWLEDVPKLIGLVLLSAYLIRLSARTVVDAYPLRAHAGPSSGAAQSSADPASAVATPRPT